MPQMRRIPTVAARALPTGSLERYAGGGVTTSISSVRIVPAAGQAVPGVGKYRYIAMLAEGGMADVYLAVFAIFSKTF